MKPAADDQRTRSGGQPMQPDAIDRLYEKLTDREQALFRTASVFPGGLTMEAARAVCCRTDANDEVLGMASSLADKGLLERQESGEELRFLLPEAPRTRARELLEASGDAEKARRRLAHYFTILAEQAALARFSHEWRSWLSRLDRERENMREALAWLKTQREASGLRLASALGWYWERRASVEGVEWLQAFLDLSSGSTMPAERAQALFYLGILKGGLCVEVYENAMRRDCFRECLRLFRQVGDHRMVAYSLTCLAFDEFELSINTRLAMLDEAVETARSSGDAATLAYCMVVAAYFVLPPAMAGPGKSLADRQASLEEAIRIARSTGDPRIIGSALFGMGMFFRVQEKHDSAEPWLRQALDIAREIDDKGLMLNTLHRLNDGCVGRHMPQKARQWLVESVRLATEIGAAGTLAYLLGSMHGIAREEGKGRKAARLFGAFCKLTKRPTPSYPMMLEMLDIDEKIFAAEFAIGETMTLDQAVAYGMSTE